MSENTTGEQVKEKSLLESLLEDPRSEEEKIKVPHVSFLHGIKASEPKYLPIAILAAYLQMNQGSRWKADAWGENFTDVVAEWNKELDDEEECLIEALLILKEAVDDGRIGSCLDRARQRYVRGPDHNG